jgi:hypothetical protein
MYFNFIIVHKRTYVGKIWTSKTNDILEPQYQLH